MINYNNDQNIIIPGRDELIKIVGNKYLAGHRIDTLRGTNCSGEMLNYLKGGKNIRLFVKKSFFKGDQRKFEEEYKIIKAKFRNIVPNQGFVSVGGNIFVFCAPIGIKIDVFLHENKNYLIEILRQNSRLLKQFKFFIRSFEELLNQGYILDLYGNENLVVSDDNKLYYLDSFFVFHKNNTVIQSSIRNLEYLKEIVYEAEK